MVCIDTMILLKIYKVAIGQLRGWTDEGTTKIIETDTIGIMCLTNKKWRDNKQKENFRENLMPNTKS